MATPGPLRFARARKTTQRRRDASQRGWRPSPLPPRRPFLDCRCHKDEQKNSRLGARYQHTAYFHVQSEALLLVERIRPGPQLRHKRWLSLMWWLRLPRREGARLRLRGPAANCAGSGQGRARLGPGSGQGRARVEARGRAISGQARPRWVKPRGRNATEDLQPLARDPKPRGNHAGAAGACALIAPQSRSG